MSYLVKCHYIINGLLNIENHALEDFETAIKFIETEVADYIKIFDVDGNLVHTTEVATVVATPDTPIQQIGEVPVETPVTIESVVVQVPSTE